MYIYIYIHIYVYIYMYMVKLQVLHGAAAWPRRAAAD